MTMRSVTLTRFSTSSLTWLLLTLNKSLPLILRLGYRLSVTGDGKVKKILIYIRYIEALARVPLFLCLVRLLRFCPLVPLLHLALFHREMTERRPREERDYFCAIFCANLCSIQNKFVPLHRKGNLTQTYRRSPT